MRRGDTIQEGLRAVTPEVVNEVRGRAPRAGGSAGGGADTVFDLPAVAAEAPKAGPGGASGGGSSTQIEGLAQVEVEEPRRQEAPPARGASVRAKGPRMVLLGTVWLSLTAVAVLGVYFVMESKHKAAEAVVATGPSKKVAIEAGPFSRGLDGEVRSFVLQMCQKVDDEPSENCDQDKLLKGEFPEKTVELPAYEIDDKEVTNRRYSECVDDGACEAVDYRACKVWTHQGLQIALRVPKIMRDPAYPVVCVRREDAATFCEWAGGVLPSDDQWEKAARGEEGPIFPWGDAWSSGLANWGEMDIARTYIVGELDGFEWTAPPGNFPKGKSPWGVFDMAGNVAEWTDAGDALKGEARGGSWTSTPFDLRATHRLFVDADERRTDVGFRCAYDG